MKTQKFKRVLPVLLALAAVLVLAACASSKLADSFDEEAVKTAAGEIVTEMNEGEYQAVVDKCTDELAEKMTAKLLSDNVDSYFSGRGDFEKLLSTAVVGQKAKDTGADSAVAVVVAQYANQKVTYTISFDTDMKLIGFYMK